MNDLQTVESLLELGRESAVCQCLVSKECVSTCGWSVQEIEKGGARRLLLVSDVGVPCNRGCALFEKVPGGGIIRTAVDQVYFRVAFGSTRGRVDVVSSKVSSNFQGLADRKICEVLITESCLASEAGSYASRIIVTYRRPFSAQQTELAHLCQHL